MTILPHKRGISFYMAVPWSTIDLAKPDGDAIITERGLLRAPYSESLKQ